eukprot:5028570-Amphidinium_carterae.1
MTHLHGQHKKDPKIDIVPKSQTLEAMNAFNLLCLGPVEKLNYPCTMMCAEPWPPMQRLADHGFARHNPNPKRCNLFRRFPRLQRSPPCHWISAALCAQ